MTLALKDYQRKALEALEHWFGALRGARDPAVVARAYEEAVRAAMGESAPIRPYRPMAGDSLNVPQACIRIPTGGGKTLLAAHAIERAARLYVGTPAPLALWLVPSDAIRTQTLDALRTPGHPYREALLAYYPADRLTVLDIADCTQLRAQDFGTRAIVAVGTIQTLRVGKTASREVYAYNENFEPHFATVPERDFFERIAEADLEVHQYLTPAALGTVKRSFANLLAWHRPIVIVDEAHNAQTDLSYEVFRRIRPACIIEWTATPASSQNVLYHVSAQELKAEHMIKLPIVLTPRPNWQEAVRDAVLARERLAGEAAAEPDYIRPIVLFQADPKDRDVPVERLKEFLTADLHVEDRRIAIATGDQRGLDGINLFDRGCPIDFIITVEALKEGWDCSFAYVFCTVQNIRSAKALEQLLGRVLRLPYARPRLAEDLNRAWAFVSSPTTANVASDLADRLVAMGFEELEAAQMVVPGPGDMYGPAGAIAPPAAVSRIELPAKVIAALTGATGLATASEGGANPQVEVTGVLPAAAIEAAVAAASKKDREWVAAQLERHQARAVAKQSPAQRGERMAGIPQLCLPVQGRLELYEPDLLREIVDFSLAGAPADLPGFRPNPDDRPYLIDLERGKVNVAQGGVQDSLALDDVLGVVERADVIRALDRRVRRDDVLQADMVAWLGRVLDWLERNGQPLAWAARHLGLLSEAVAERLTQLARDGRQRAFQQSLLEGPTRACLGTGHDFRFLPDVYPARWHYAGRYQFSKHYYPLPGELKSEIDAEETVCAIEIDSLPEVKYWVRNLERQPASSFWLPTATDRFYPDFVAELTDGRLFVIEYKGAQLYNNDDSREKRDIGDVWAAASNGRCIFAMVTSTQQAGKSVAAQLREAVAR